MNEKGLCYVLVPCGSSGAEWIASKAGFHIITGESPRNSAIDHAVVVYAGEIVHDPHFSRDGLVNHKKYGYFVPLNPVSKI
jgi:hypothetical protein